MNKLFKKQVVKSKRLISLEAEKYRIKEEEHRIKEEKHRIKEEKHRLDGRLEAEASKNNFSGSLEDEIKKKKLELEALSEKKLRLEGYIAELELGDGDMANNVKNIDHFHLREGSEMAKIENLMVEAARPLHINEIIVLLGIDDMRKKISLAGSLNQYARKKRVFVKIGKNTFGLIDAYYR